MLFLCTDNDLLNLIRKVSLSVFHRPEGGAALLRKTGTGRSVPRPISGKKQEQLSILNLLISRPIHICRDLRHISTTSCVVTSSNPFSLPDRRSFILTHRTMQQNHLMGREPRPQQSTMIQHLALSNHNHHCSCNQLTHLYCIVCINRRYRP